MAAPRGDVFGPIVQTTPEVVEAVISLGPNPSHVELDVRKRPSE